jgi:uncharacterized protein YdhG (YjbR/CyaY superfamily)
MKSYKNTDEYIKNYPADVQVLLTQLRTIILKVAPKAEEAIKYGIPTFVLNGNLVHFGGFKNHIGFFPGASGVKEFKKELSAYNTTKGTIQFPLNEKIPAGLVARIVKFRVKENLRRAK